MATLSDITSSVTDRFKSNESVLDTAFVYNDSGTLEGKGGCWWTDKNTLGDSGDVPAPGNDYVVFQIGMRNKSDRTQFYCDGNTFSKRNVDTSSDDAFSEWVQQNKAVLTESYKSSSAWYRKYSDGYIEQAGVHSNTSTSGTITFPTAFGDTNYSIVISQRASSVTDTGGWGMGVALNPTKTTTTSTYSVQETCHITWYACGY